MSHESMSTAGRLTVETQWSDGIAYVSLEGELDLASAGQVEEQLASAEARSPTRIVVDLGSLAFIDSTGLRTLIQANVRAREQGWDLLLRPGGESIQRVFELTGALDVLTFEVNRDA